MRHRKQKSTLGRERAQRVALLKSLAEHLILREAIETTDAKARALKRVIEPLVTKAKRGTLSDRRAVIASLFTESAVRKLFVSIAPRYAARPGGYTRITAIGYRAADHGKKVRIEFV